MDFLKERCKYGGYFHTLSWNGGGILAWYKVSKGKCWMNHRARLTEGLSVYVYTDTTRFREIDGAELLECLYNYPTNPV